ncbi:MULTISPECIES: radical SAM protein [Clostridium]|uniref:Radical SAM protein n=1 Tax=Clostridium cibarium TaxID=2762247 RepID=A0ABR8PW83_9CLOT|nr:MULTISPECIES: radical SAM protein [Clostridium]MBD7912400.1 radical SAM protein [Clostridium cibarium]
MKNKKSIIWNLTRACAWNCKFCCVSAKYVKDFEKINLGRDENYRFQGELDFNSKVRIIDQLKEGDFRIDFSGGDLLIDPLNLDLIIYASEKLGKENVGISISGAFVTEEIVERLRGKINDVEITLDYLPYYHYKMRPAGYHEYAAKAMKLFESAGFVVGAQTVITKDNISKEKLMNLYSWLEENKIDEWSILRFFSSGRGKYFSELKPTHEEYCQMVDYIKEITAKGNIKVDFQYLLPNHEKYTLDCRAVKRSIGILTDGTVVGCFWALDENMKPVDDRYILGKLPDMNIYDILENKKSKYWLENENSCGFFTYEELECMV